jgi:hypothetical protein
MRARLEKSGWSQHDIELALDPEKAEKEKKKKKKHRYSSDVYLDDDIIVVGGGPPTLPDAPPLSVGFPQHHVPVFPRINRKFLDIETLEHYHVPWEWDRVSFCFPPLSLSPEYLTSNTDMCAKTGEFRIHHSPARTRQVRDRCAVRTHASPSSRFFCAAAY